MSNEQMSLGVSADKVMELVKGELSSRRRWLYRIVLGAAATVLSLTVSLWVTEPDPLPTRLHFAFAVMCGIAGGWVIVLSWLLLRRNCPTAIDRIATSWMATAATATSLVVSVGIALMRNEVAAAVGLAALGFVLLAAAIVSLRSAYGQRSRLLQQLEQLKASS